MYAIDQNSLVDLVFQLEWRSTDARHVEVLHAANVNIWRDWLPRRFVSDLMGNFTGDRIQLALSSGEGVPETTSSDRASLPIEKFDGATPIERRLYPRGGRFYPKGILKDMAGIFRENHTPFRCLKVGENSVDLDLGHPLAGKPLTLSATVGAVQDKKVEKGGTSVDWIGLLADGPGMQARFNATPTQFFLGDPFVRDDDAPDTVFYEKPRFVQHIDKAAIDMIRILYGASIKEGMKVLDLMSSWTSHLPENVRLPQVTVLGMNESELKRNPRATDSCVQDLNATPVLPFPSETYDAAVCTVSVEYLVHPVAVFQEVARVLKPGGIFLVSFSDRWFPPKAVRIWKELHDFERMGLVSEYFWLSGAFTDLTTYSVRGLPRPVDDKYYPQRLNSDPVYLVKGKKRAI
jgi:SAM-dependent methyltransferase